MASSTAHRALPPDPITRRRPSNPQKRIRADHSLQRSASQSLSGNHRPLTRRTSDISRKNSLEVNSLPNRLGEEEKSSERLGKLKPREVRTDVRSTSRRPVNGLRRDRFTTNRLPLLTKSIESGADVSKGSNLHGSSGSITSITALNVSAHATGAVASTRPSSGRQLNGRPPSGRQPSSGAGSGRSISRTSTSTAKPVTSSTLSHSRTHQPNGTNRFAEDSPIHRNKAMNGYATLNDSSVNSLNNAMRSSLDETDNTDYYRSNSRSGSSGLARQSSIDKSAVHTSPSSSKNPVQKSVNGEQTSEFKISLRNGQIPKDTDAFSRVMPDDTDSLIKSDSDHELLTCSGGLVGLRNLGNTCFMNSILQCLNKTRPLIRYCLSLEYKKNINRKSNMKGELFEAYASLMKELWDGDLPVSPSSFKASIQQYAPRFYGYSQQDSQEFLRYLVEGLHEDINRVKTKPKLPTINYVEDDRLKPSVKAEKFWNRYRKTDDSKVLDMFVGQLCSTLTCDRCNSKSMCFDPFWDLSLSIPNGSEPCNLHSCFKLFMRKETLDGEEKPTCGSCQSRQKCTKALGFHRLPQILVIHLKRFSGLRYRSKLNTTVEFSETLDMSRYIDEDTIKRCGGTALYSLYAVSNHIGSCSSGHYTASVKHPTSSHWHTYNDTRVNPTSFSTVVSNKAYILFYERVMRS